MATPEASLV